MKRKTADTFPLIISKGHASVKIYKGTNRGKDIFTLSYVTASGRQRENFMDLEEARREANTRAALLAQGDLEALKLTGRERQIFVAAAEALSPTGVSLDIAAREFAKAFEILGHDGIIEAARFFKRHKESALPDITTTEAAERFHAAKMAEGMSRKYLKDIRLITRKLSTCFQCNLKSITADELSDYMARLKMGAVAKNNHRRVIVALFNHAKAQGWLNKVETTAADALNVVKVKRTPPEIFTPEEMAALLSNASERFLPYLALIAFGGVRADEITDDEPKPGQSKGQLRWEDIDFDRNCVIVPEMISKTIRRKIEMPANLRAWLAPYRGRKGFIYEVDPSTDRANCCKAAGVQWKANAHRHSFASYRLEQTKNAGQVALEMGNSPGVVLRSYADVVHAEDAARYWGIIPEELGKVISLSAAAA